MSTRWPLAVQSFHREEQGTVAIMFAMMSFVLFFLSGMAIDYGRIQDLRSRVSDAVDAASLAAGRAMLDGKLTDDEIIELAKSYFAQNSRSASTLASTSEPDVKIDRENGKVDISVNSEIAMTLTRIGGFDKIDVPVTSTATFQQRDIEVGMALDITKSMDETINGRAKIDSLKWAFTEFTKELFPENLGSQRVRVALAPYSGSIKLGDYAAAATAGRSTDGCVTERADSSASGAVGQFYAKADGVNDVDPAGGLKNSYDCPNAKPAITPLLDNKSTLDDIVDGYQTTGSTGGHFGIQWAWNLISEEWDGAFTGDSAPAPYSEVTNGKLMKAVVLLTDGEFNTAFHGQTSAEQAIAMCDAMKAKDVIVFSVGFGLGNDPNALNTLKTCATPGESYFANADNEEELTTVLRQFASKLGQLRLSK